MKFGIMGPYLIYPDRDHRIRAGKHRSLLAILTVNPNAFVTVGRLSDELWLGSPPGSADNLIRQYVSAVRRELRDGSIITLSGGYRLDLRTGDLDLDHFDGYLNQAHREIGNGRLDAASEALSQALSLWRGDPLGDIEQTPSIVAEARRLVERRLSAIEQRIDLDVRRGRHDAALDEMAALVTLHPEREGLRARQMRALFATGRRADALAAFREGREALIERIGIEPGRELQRIHHQILVGDLPVESRPQVATTTPQSRPAQLPPDLPDLISRDGELAAIVDFVTRPAETAPVVVVSGKVGVGKSVLVTHAGHALRDRFPDGQLFLSLTGTTPAAALRDALRALGGPPVAAGSDLRELHNAYATELLDRRILVVADDATEESDVRALVPAGSRSALLVTSRSVLPGIEGAHHLKCHPLTEASAVTMLSAIIGEQRATADPGAVRSLVRSLGCLPLALRIAGGRLLVHQWRSVRLLAKRLLHNPLDELAYGGLAIRPRLAESVSYLTEVEQRVFRRAGVLRWFDVDTAAKVAGITAEEAARAVDRLLEIHLVDPVGDDPAGRERFMTDFLIREYAYERLLVDDPLLSDEGAICVQRYASAKSWLASR